jgi:uncharacterized Zn-binding protein involved in type VI secretion
MGVPAAVAGDQITGICIGHVIPGPPVGNPVPGPPFPFSAPLTLGLSTSVLICGKPAALMGSSGFNTPPHVGLHPTDPFFAPPTQQGRVVSGSTTVLVENKPLATMSSQCTMCLAPATTLVASAATVLVG